jgi:hypothetical protein
MDESLARYLYEKVIDDFQNDDPVLVDAASAMDVYGVVDALRRCVGEADVPLLLERAGSPWNASAALAVSLLRRYAGNVDVQEALRKLWHDDPTFERRFELLFRLLDDPTLPIELHQEIHAFVFAHRERFAHENIRWAGGRAFIWDRVRTRLADSSFPRQKAWIYLLMAADAGNDAATAELLAPYVATDDFNGRVAAALLREVQERMAC